MIVDSPRGTAHPRYPEIIYLLDYGYPEVTSSDDGEGIDVFIGNSPGRGLVAVALTVDIVKNDIEVN